MRGIPLPILRLALAAAVLLGAAPARAQTPQSSPLEPPERPLTQSLPGVPQPGPVDPDTYRLGPGDVLEIVTWGRYSLQYDAEVDPEGRIYVRDIGPIAVSGFSLNEARRRVIAAGRRILSGVSIDVRIKRVRRSIVYVTGEVRTPGATEVTGVARVAEAIERAGGLGEYGSERNIRVRTKVGDSLLVDLTRFRRLGDLDANPLVGGGDVIWVPARMHQIGAYGGVVRPGEVEFRAGETVADLLTLAGGPSPASSREGAYLLRYAGPTRLDTIPIGIGPDGRPEPNLPLRERDRLFLREQGDWKRSRLVRVGGEVVNPGAYAIAEESMRLTETIAGAGGFTPNGDRHKVLLIRPSTVRSQADPQLERLSRLSRSEMTDAEYQAFQTKLASQRGIHIVDFIRIAQGDSSHDVLVQDGDSVVVHRIEFNVRVGGEVRQPGLVNFEPGLAAKEYVRRSGGFTERASTGKLRITRAATGQTMLARDAGEIQPGDFLWVPEKREINGWRIFRDLIAVAGSVAAIIVLIRD
jgi:protein involved in polysaccharide export with SLBB domain